MKSRKVKPSEVIRAVDIIPVSDDDGDEYLPDEYVDLSSDEYMETSFSENESDSHEDYLVDVENPKIYILKAKKQNKRVKKSTESEALLFKM